MPRMRETRNPDPMIRTTLTIDADVQVALKWLRSPECPAPITASALLRQAAHAALRDHGHTVLFGRILTVDEFAEDCERKFAETLASKDT